MSNENMQNLIQTINQQWDAAFNAGDAKSVASLYDAEGSVLPAGGKQVTGADNIHAFWVSTLAQGFTDHKITLIEVGADGNLAFQRGLWQAAAVNADGERHEYSGNLHVLYRRQADGSWKALTHIWN